MLDIVRLAVAEGKIMSCCESLLIAGSCPEGVVYVDTINPSADIVDGCYTDSEDRYHVGNGLTNMSSNTDLDVHITNVITIHH